MRIREKIIEILSGTDYKPTQKEDLAHQMNIDRKDYRLFFKVLRELERESIVHFTKHEKVMLMEHSNLFRGILRGSGEKYCYFSPHDKPIDLFIPPKYLNGAIHQDEVLVQLIEPGIGNDLPVGKVIKIVHRERNKLVGRFEMKKKFGFVILDNPKYGFDVFVKKSDFNEAAHNEKVVVKLTNTKVGKGSSPQGVVVEVLGFQDDPGMDITSVVKKYDLIDDFPKKVLQKASEISQKVTKSDLKGRVDFRDLFTVTIDGKDAKDFDDAISIKKEGSSYILYVHIADVDHYVPKNSALDKEAYRRGTSVYLLDRVLPMLPKELSNGICSLNPNEDRLTLTVKMEINAKGKVLDYKFYQSVIQSDYRLVYDDVSSFLESEPHPFRDEVLCDHLTVMRELFEILKRKRQHRGSIDFNFDETEIELDQDGRAIDVRRANRRVANQIIEEFMIVTNETVASHFGYMNHPFMYRIHQEPDEEKVQDFLKIISIFDYHLKGKKLYSKDYQALLEACQGKPEESLISLLLLRSMRKAVYSEEHDMHFGLASMFYCHFTSPIRRYPDLFVHRIVKAAIEKKDVTNNEKEFLKYTKKCAIHCSKQEKTAEDSEREVQDIKCAEYMENHIGEEFDAVVCSLTEFGIFVRLDNTIEGLVSYHYMDDYYIFDQKNYIVRGQSGHKEFKIGQKVKVELISTSKEKGQIDFKMIG